LAKSVGWGWLGYHAFVAGNRLAGCVPPVLGLRDGILYSDWVHEPNHKPLRSGEMIQTLANYVATRANELRFKSDGGMDVTRDSQPARGLEELAGRLSGAYGKAGGILKRARMKRELSAMESHQPALIDGRMRPMEWIPTDGTMLKSDFEHHGIGKHQLNLTDPAYDLAETILHWNLSEEEERELLDAYAARSQDHTVHSRIFLHKILAGSWWMDRAIENINDPRLLSRHGEFNRQYIEAWNFLVLQTMRFCARLCRKPAKVQWSSPLAVLDVDGVIDKQVFGFPSTSMAGMEAISLLHQHGFAVMLNTARSIPEVKAYCRAYGFAGGVSEYGAHIWDAVSGKERVLISDESLDKLARVRNALSRIPGVFLNDDFHYSIKAYTYEHGRCVPIPRVVVQDIVAALGIDGLGIHPTYTDTAIISAETDKARGMVELIRLAGLTDADTHAIGDTASDLPMFRAAVHSYAPGNVSCGPAARLLKCRIASRAYQSGLLESVRAMIESTGIRNLQNPGVEAVLAPQEKYFVRLLEIADRSSMVSLVHAAADPMSLQTFIAE
jgi:hydroxymethylpyrimidine pyrophosphatase-like HAD family hydrolase